MEGSGLSGLLVVPKSVSLQGLDLACSMGPVLLSSSKLKQIFSSALGEIPSAQLSSLMSLVPSLGDGGCVRKGSVPFLFLDTHLCQGVEETGSSLGTSATTSCLPNLSLELCCSLGEPYQSHRGQSSV